MSLDADVDQLAVDHTDLVAGGGRSTSIGQRLLAVIRAIPHVGVISGVLLALIGVGLLVLAWTKTANLLEVGRQIPWLISAGFGGVCMVVLGLTVVNLSVKHADASERRRQLAELRQLLAELRDEESS